MSMTYIQELMNELEKPLRILSTPGACDPEEIIANYQTFRELTEEMETDEDYRDSGFAQTADTCKATIIRVINRNMKNIVSCIYENMRDDLERAKTIEDRIRAIARGKSLLDTLEEYPEHANHPYLQKALGAIEAYEAKLDDALEREEEAEFRREMAGIEYTATDRQVKYLLSLGAKPPQLQGITKERASAMITRLTMAQEQEE